MYHCLLRLTFLPPIQSQAVSVPPLILEKRLAISIPPFTGLKIMLHSPILEGTTVAKRLDELQAFIGYATSIFDVDLVCIQEDYSLITLEAKEQTYTLQAFEATSEYYKLAYGFQEPGTIEPPTETGVTNQATLRLTIYGPDKELIAAGESYTSLAKEITLPLPPTPGMQVSLAPIGLEKFYAQECQDLHKTSGLLPTEFIITRGYINIDEGSEYLDMGTEYEISIGVSTDSLDQFYAALKLYSHCYGFYDPFSPSRD